MPTEPSHAPYWSSTTWRYEVPDKDTEKAQEATQPAHEPVAEERVSAKKPIVAPDGHVNLSKEDIENRA